MVYSIAMCMLTSDEHNTKFSLWRLVKEKKKSQISVEFKVTEKDKKAITLEMKERKIVK